MLKIMVALILLLAGQSVLLCGCKKVAWSGVDIPGTEEDVEAVRQNKSGVCVDGGERIYKDEISELRNSGI